jgi:hypothetical protein
MVISYRRRGGTQLATPDAGVKWVIASPDPLRCVSLSQPHRGGAQRLVRSRVLQSVVGEAATTSSARHISSQARGANPLKKKYVNIAGGGADGDVRGPMRQWRGA